MVSTYRLMSQVLIEENKKFTNEELAIKYQEKQEPSVLAEIFCRNFPMWIKCANSSYFSRVPNDEKTSVVVERLNHAMLHFDITKGFKFTTYANKVIMMGLYREVQYFKHDSMDVANCVPITNLTNENTNIDKGCLIDDTVEQLQYSEELYDDVELRESIQNSNMKEREKLVCNIILDNPGITDIEIANMLKLHRHTIRKIKIDMRNKVMKICTQY